MITYQAIAATRPKTQTEKPKNNGLRKYRLNKLQSEPSEKPIVFAIASIAILHSLDFYAEKPDTYLYSPVNTIADPQ